MVPTLWLLFLLVAIPVVLYFGRYRRPSPAEVVILLSALVGLWHSPAAGPPVSPWILEFLVTLLLFRLGGRVHLEDLRQFRTLLWTGGFLFSALVAAAVFHVLPFFRSHPVSLALVLQAGAPVVFLAFLWESRPHGVTVRTALLGAYVHLTFVFLFLFALQGSGLGEVVERFAVFLLASGAVGTALGLSFSYLEAKIEEEFYLLLLVVGTLVFLQGIYGALHLFTGITVLIAGAVASNTSLKHQRLWHVLDPYEYPAVLLFLGLVFLGLRWVSWSAFLWGLLGVLVVAGGLRWAGTALVFRSFPQDQRVTLATFTLAQGGIGLWLLHRALPDAAWLGLPLAVASLIGLPLWRRVFAPELSLVVHMPIETFWPPEAALLVHRFRRWLRRVPESQSPTASELLRTQYLTVPSEATLEELVQALLKAQAHAVPVVDEQRRVLGIVRGRDLEHLFTDEQTRHLIRAIDVMVPHAGLEPDTPASRILDQMNQLDTDCLPVAAEGKILGVVLKRDLLTRHV